MADAPDLSSLKQELMNRKVTSNRWKNAHNQASVLYAKRNNLLVIGALTFSGLAGVTSLLGLRIAAITTVAALVAAGFGFLGTISSGAQKTNWGAAERIERHHNAAAEYSSVVWRAERALAEASADDKASREHLASELKEIDDSLYKILKGAPELPNGDPADPSTELEKLDKLHKTGLVDIRNGRGNLIDDKFRSKPKKVEILETWTGYSSQLDVWIQEAIKKNDARVKILLLNPDSEHVESRAKALDQAVDVKNEIEADLKLLAATRNRLGEDKNKLEIKLYDAAPVVNMYRFDDTRIIGMYLWQEDSIMGPQFVVKASESSRSAFLANQFDKHFEHLDGQAEVFSPGDSLLPELKTRPRL